MGLLILWFFYYYLSDIISMFYLRKKPCSGIVIGLFGGLTCNYWHSTLEWSLKQYNNFAGQMIVYAVIAVIAVNRKNIKAAYLRSEAWKKIQEKREKKKRPRFAFQYSPGGQAVLPSGGNVLQIEEPPSSPPEADLNPPDTPAGSGPDQV